MSGPFAFEEHGSGSLLHGTRADLVVGDLLVPGRPVDHGSGRTAGHVHVTRTLDAAAWGVEPVRGRGPGRTHLVEPTGQAMRDGLAALERGDLAVVDD